MQQKNSRPNHPTTCGKVERLHQTLKRWLAARPRPVSLNDLQQLLDAFVTEYNEQRPHRSLQRRTPLAAYRATPKAGPTGTDTATQTRVRTDRVDKAGKVTLRVNGTMFHIAVGRTHARTRIKLLVHDLDVTIIDATTGGHDRAEHRSHTPLPAPEQRENPPTRRFEGFLCPETGQGGR